MKGIIFTLDAGLAIIISLMLIAGIFQALSALPTPNSDDLARICQDSLASMENGGLLKEAVGKSSPLPLNEFTKNLPSNLCYSIAITDQIANSPIITDENCACKTSSNAYRSFLAGSPSKTYLAVMSSCYK